MWIEAFLIAVIALLLFWIYYSRGGTFKSLELKNRVEELEKENEDLRGANRGLRQSFSEASERLSRPVEKACRLTERLVKVRDAVKGSSSVGEDIEEEFGAEMGPELVRKILASEEGIGIPLKKRLVQEILVGEIGRQILKGLRQEETVEDISADIGVPLRVCRERVRILKETGFLDNKLNLTKWGEETLGL